MGSDWIFAI